MSRTGPSGLRCFVIRRSHSGLSLAEFAVGLLVLIPLVLCFIDLSAIVLAVQLNDQVCREAARIASLGDPAQALVRANAVINKASGQAGGMVSNLHLIDLENSVTQFDLDKLKPLGGPVEGTVKVRTEVDVRPMAVHYLIGAKSPLIFSSKQSFPFTYIVPGTLDAKP